MSRWNKKGDRNKKIFLELQAEKRRKALSAKIYIFFFLLGFYFRLIRYFEKEPYDARVSRTVL